MHCQCSILWTQLLLLCSAQFTMICGLCLALVLSYHQHHCSTACKHRLYCVWDSQFSSVLFSQVTVLRCFFCIDSLLICSQSASQMTILFFLLNQMIRPPFCVDKPWTKNLIPFPFSSLLSMKVSCLVYFSKQTFYVSLSSVSRRVSASESAWFINFCAQLQNKITTSPGSGRSRLRVWPQPPTLVSSEAAVNLAVSGCETSCVQLYDFVSWLSDCGNQILD